MQEDQMRIGLLRLGAWFVFGFCGVAAHAQDRGKAAPDTPAAVPKMTVVYSDRVPVRLKWARITDDNGQQVVACEMTNIADELLARLEMTLLVYDGSGRRLGTQVDEAPEALLPIEAHGTRRFQFQLRTVAVQPDDQVWLGVTTVASGTRLWTNAAFDAEADAAVEKAAPRDSRPDQPSSGTAQPIVINSADAPAAVADAVVVRTPTGAPLVIHVTVNNRTGEPLTLTEVEAFIFSEDGHIRTIAFRSERRPLAVSASRIQSITVSPMVANAKVLVTVARAATATRSWQNHLDKDQARALLNQPR
jgi:hypothetical protein